MWNIKEINEKKKYCISKLNNKSLSNEEKEKLQFSLLAYLQMLDSSGTVFHTVFPKVIDIISGGKYTLQRTKKYQKITRNLDTSGSISYYDQRFLVKLVMIIADEESSYKEFDFEKINIDDCQLISLAHDFYKRLGDKEIYDLALKTLSNESCINFTEKLGYKKDYLGGNMYWDYIYNNPYLNIYRHNTICDFNSLIHETMHTIDFGFMPKIKTKYNTGVIEIPTFTTDFLVIDYLESLELKKEELEKYKKQKFLNIQVIADKIFLLIKERYNEFNKNSNIDFIINILKPEINLLLIKLKAAIVSYGLYLQIKKDKEKGLSNLKKYMKQGVLKHQGVDFSFIELSDQNLIEIAIEFKEQVNSLDNHFKKDTYSK